MKQYIEHVIRNDFSGIVERSLLHCHLRDVHSLLFSDAPERRIRLFVADIGNELWKNSQSRIIAGEKMSVAFHPHHCNVTLHVVKGELVNWLIYFGNVGINTYTRFQYNSQIRDAGISFTPVGEDRLEYTRPIKLGVNDYHIMRAEEIHTVSTPKDQIVAWFVYEGKEDPAYQPLSWSNAPLDQMSFEGLYQKPDEKDVRELLRMSGLLSGN
jgi:hypothetical protein